MKRDTTPNEVLRRKVEAERQRGVTDRPFTKREADERRSLADWNHIIKAIVVPGD